jgi:hypothetical protein
MRGWRQWPRRRALQIIDPNKYISVALLAFDFEPSLLPFCGEYGGRSGPETAKCKIANLQKPKTPAIRVHTKFQWATGVIVFTTAIDPLR